jgi:hypothetical protein
MKSNIRVVRPNIITELQDGVAAVEVTRLNGEVIMFLIDSGDIPRARACRWYSHNGYCCTTKEGRQWYLTWELFGKPEKGFVQHHINGNPRDNRRSNIRLVTRRMNNLFRKLPPNRTTGRRGVYRYASGAIVALIGPNGIRKCFSKLEDAIRARIRFERSLLLTIR